MLIGKPKIVSESYEIKVRINTFRKLINEDYDEYKSFSDSLENLGADKVDYNGHFGNYIFFNLDTRYKKNLPKIIEVIKNRLQNL